jgi:flagellar assembly protein FliH
MPGVAAGNRLSEGSGLSLVQLLRAAAVAEHSEILAQILHSLSAPLEQMDQELEQQLLEVAIAVARQVIRREIKCDPNQIIAVVREARAELPDSQREITLVLHPEDATLVHQLLLARADETAWRIEEDPTLTRGGCKVMTNVSYVDATLESRVAKIAARVLGGERHSDHGVVEPSARER